MTSSETMYQMLLFLFLLLVFERKSSLTFLTYDNQPKKREFQGTCAVFAPSPSIIINRFCIDVLKGHCHAIVP